MKKILFILAAMLLGSIGLHAGTQIIYYAPAQLTTGFLEVGKTTLGPAITNHTFSNGKGTITCSGEITQIGWNAFSFCESMTSIEIPNSVTKIDDYAFDVCSGLKSVSIPNSVTSIGFLAFSRCESMTSIEIPNSVTFIAHYAFSRCLSLKAVTIPNSVTTIEEGVFENCIRLTSVTIPNSVTKIGTNAFFNCKELMAVTIPNSVTSIGAGAFGDCESMTSIEIPNSVTSIGRSAFSNCKALKAVTIPNSVTTIEEGTFSNCKSMTLIEIPNAVTSIGSSAFSNCTGLSSVTVNWTDAQSIVSVDSNVFQRIANGAGPIGAMLYVPEGTANLYKQANVWKEFGEIIEFNNCKITYTASSRLPLRWDSITFGSEIREHSFHDGQGTITCAGEITKIGEDAFSLCVNLTSITIPKSVTKIETSAFEGCSSLTSVTVAWTDAQSIVSVDSNVFQGIANGAGPSGARLYVPAGTYNLYKQANVWKEFGEIIDPNTISYTASAQLSGDQFKMGETTFGPAITNHEFSNGIGVITCSGRITKIADGAFVHSGITSITLPPFITQIGKGAFENCGQLQSIILPSSLSLIGAGSFQSTALTSITIPASVERIDGWAFQQCPNLKEVIIPSSSRLTFIGEQAFYNSGLTSIDIPSSVTTIEKGAFNACSRLTKTNYTGTVADWCKIKFADYTANPILYSHNLLINNVEIKNLVIPQNVTTIEDNAFYSCSGFNSVTIGDSVIKIGERAFWGCSGVEFLTIPASVKEIGFIAFKNCTKLDSLEFAKRESTNPINIDTYAFENTALTSVVIPDCMKEIPKGLFYKNSQLKAIYLPTSVENINYQSFGECKNLKYIFSVSQMPPVLAEGAFEGHDKNDSVIVYVPSQDAKVAYQQSNWSKYFTNFVTDIEYRIISTSDKTAEVVSAIPFEGTVSIPGTTILDGTYYNVIGIGDSTFKYNELLTSISLSPTLQYIGNDAFYYCKKLKKVQLPEDLQTIGDRAFSYTALDTIVIPEGVQSLGRAAFAFNSLHYVSLPTGLKNIPDDCFRNCYFGTEIIVPEGVETIGTGGLAFAYSPEKVTLITLPSTLKEIKNSAFENRNGLKEVICLAPTPPTLGVNVFTNKDIAIVYVPNRDVLKIYRDSSLWKNYKFKFDDLMAKTNKAYLYEVAGNNKEAQEIARQYCDSIDKATTAAQVEFFTNKALALIDPYTLNDYKGRLADTLESIANTCPDSAAKPIALGIAAEYRNKIMLAIFRQDAEKIFAEGLAKINEVFELVELKKTCCNNLRNSAQNLRKEIIEIAEDFCKQINNAITKEEVNKIYKEGSQVIAMYTYIEFYWSGSPDDGCQTTKGYYDEY